MSPAKRGHIVAVTFVADTTNVSENISCVRAARNDVAAFGHGRGNIVDTMLPPQCVLVFPGPSLQGISPRSLLSRDPLLANQALRPRATGLISFYALYKLLDPGLRYWFAPIKCAGFAAQEIKQAKAWSSTAWIRKMKTALEFIVLRNDRWLNVTATWRARALLELAPDVIIIANR